MSVFKWAQESLRLEEVDDSLEHSRWVNEGKSPKVPDLADLSLTMIVP